MPESAQFAEFVADIEPGLRRALAEEFGPEAGREATLDALAFAWANWDRVISAPDPEGYLTQVGQTAAERHVTDPGDVTGDVTVILPPSQAGFDTVVAPVRPAEATARADELAGGAAATTALPRTAAAATGVMGATTARLPLTPVPEEPPSRRTGVWVAAAALVGAIALGGIAVAARSGDDGLDPVESTTLATLPTTIEVVTSLPRTLPPTTTLPPATAPPVTSVRVTDTLPEITAPDDDDSGSDSGSGSDSDDTQAGDGESDDDSGDTSATTRRRTTTTGTDESDETSAPVDSEPPTETSSDEGAGAGAGTSG